MSNQNKYANGKIYKIICIEDPDQFYIGSTTKTLSQRWATHKKDAKKEIHKTALVYQTLNETGFDKFVIELIEDYPCNSRTDLLKRETHWFELLQPPLNVLKPWVSDEEKKMNQKEKMAAYRINNKDKLQVMKKKYYANTKEEIKTRMAQYYIDNKEQILQKKAKYRKENKEKINRKVDCSFCGRNIVQRDLKRHQNTALCKRKAYVEIEFISSDDDEVEIEYID